MYVNISSHTQSHMHIPTHTMSYPISIQISFTHILSNRAVKCIYWYIYHTHVISSHTLLKFHPGNMCQLLSTDNSPPHIGW